MLHNEKINIRQAEIVDLEELQRLFIDTVEATCKRDYSREQIEVWTSSVQNIERWKRKILDQFFVLAELDDKVIGFGSLEGGKHIDMMYVHKNHLRMGIAQRIYNTLQAEAYKGGNEELTSDVSKTALPFFEKVGFAIVKENEFDLNGVMISNYFMRL